MEDTIWIAVLDSDKEGILFIFLIHCKQGLIS